MGKRSRQVKQQREGAAAATTKRDRMARVQVDDATWADFRKMVGYRPVSEVLGELVTREVERYRSRRLREGELDDREVVEALERARAQQQDLQAIVERLERAAEAQRGFEEPAE
jgi:DTW domain-containing protein YfiP